MVALPEAVSVLGINRLAFIFLFALSGCLGGGGGSSSSVSSTGPSAQTATPAPTVEDEFSINVMSSSILHQDFKCFN